MIQKHSYINREVSWLHFNNRVLYMADRQDIPIVERLRFVVIASNNLDEFYMIRVGGLFDQLHLKNSYDNKTELTASQQLKLISKLTLVHQKQLNQMYIKVVQALTQLQVNVHHPDDLKANEIEYVGEVFKQQIKLKLTCVIIDRRHPFPQLLNKETYLFVLLKKEQKQQLGFIHLHKAFIPEWITIPFGLGLSLVLTEDLIEQSLDQLFKGYDVIESSLVRMTRNADLDLDVARDEDMDFREVMKHVLENRKKLQPVRLEMNRNVLLIKEELIKHLQLDPNHVFIRKTPFSFGLIRPIETFLKKREPDAFFKPFTSAITPYLKQNHSIISQVLKHDVYLIYPYDSFDSFIDLLNEASLDQRVVAINITLYRVAKNSQVITALKKAAENGKMVTVVIELKARFDEESNIEWSSELEEAGCRVIFGFVGYKVHAKIVTIVMNNQEKKQVITHIATGNYNEITAKQYSDISLLTSHQKIGEDAIAFFDMLVSQDLDILHRTTLTHFLIAPVTFKTTLLQYIQQEINYHQKHQNGHIIFKVNALTDKEIIDALIAAAQAGVQVDLNIRGINCLMPQQNMNIVSHIGRYLEHARLYYFNHHAQNTLLLSSADAMTRNTQKRIELAIPILDLLIKEDIITYLKTMMIPTANMWVLSKKGIYKHQSKNIPKIDNQTMMQNQPHYIQPQHKKNLIQRWNKK